MADRHTLLRRQLKRHFPSGDVPDSLRPLLDDVAQAYLEFDADRSMLERSLDLSSQELLQANATLREAHRDLERRVEERTADLAKAYADLRREMSERHAAEQERQRLEEDLRHAQKMEAVGRLAGGIAHDFNNLLTAVQGYAEMLLHALKDSPLRQDVEEIYRASERAAVLTRQLLAFSRRQILSPENIDLNASVREMSRMLGRLIGEHITIDLCLAPDAWNVHADAAQLEQAIVNLGVNARDAMPNGGRLVIETGNHQLTTAGAAVLGLAPGAYATVCVRDTGTGIAPDIRARIFDPFFTTKPVGQGTGLGLAMVYGFVRQTGGSVTVDSEPGQGTTFTLHLPRAAAVTPKPAPNRHDAPADLPGTGTILVVEDERPIRRLVATALSQAGYKTFEAADGQEAIEIFAQHSDDIALVVTDVVMPRIGGHILAERLRSLHPRLPLLYMTGYAEEGDALRHSAPGASVLLKPFSPDTLLRTVRQLLRQS